MAGRTMPFTATQWQELEQQALIFKHMASGIPIPPDLLLTVERSLEYSLTARLLHHQYQAEWNCFQMGFGKKIDPEPGRCRRTDGKKWRCSKEAYPDSKYCERHIHRGRNRSRKPAAAATATTNPSASSTPISLSAYGGSSSSSMASETSHPFLFPHSSSWRTPGLDLSPYDKSTTHLLMDSGMGLKPDSDYRYYDSGVKNQIAGYPFIQPHGSADSSKPMQSYSDDRRVLLGYGNEYAMSKDDDKSNKVMHQFLDPWPSNGDDSWVDQKEKIGDYAPVSTSQLSVSFPPVCHDFLMTHNGS